MPRWASRLTLVVEGVRVEPLQSIDPIDACEEGITWTEDKPGADKRWSVKGTGIEAPFPVPAYEALWSSLHTKEGQRWEDNPEVVVLTFRVVRGNIDQVSA